MRLWRQLQGAEGTMDRAEQPCVAWCSRRDTQRHWGRRKPHRWPMESAQGRTRLRKRQQKGNLLEAAARRQLTRREEARSQAFRGPLRPLQTQGRGRWSREPKRTAEGGRHRRRLLGCGNRRRSAAAGCIVRMARCWRRRRGVGAVSPRPPSTTTGGGTQRQLSAGHAVGTCIAAAGVGA